MKFTSFQYALLFGAIIWSAVIFMYVQLLDPFLLPVYLFILMLLWSVGSTYLIKGDKIKR